MRIRTDRTHKTHSAHTSHLLRYEPRNHNRITCYNLLMDLKSLPKIELHRHLEGSVRPRTVAEICRERGVPLPTYDPDELARLITLSKPVENLAAFLELFKTIDLCFTDKEAIARIAYEATEDASLDNIRYVELRFSVECMAYHHRLSLRDVMDGIVEGVDLAMRKLPVIARLIISISRDMSAETMGVPWPEPAELARLAVDYMDRGVVGLDLSGREFGFGAELFIEPFKIAKDAGLGITVHAGEADGPQSVRAAVELLGATRIGHGVRIVQDPSVVQMAVDRGVTLEVCPTSNVLTHAVESLEAHPVRKLFDAGVPITINTDDPAVCGVTLTGEYSLIHEKFGFSLEEIEQLDENARKARFV